MRDGQPPLFVAATMLLVKYGRLRALGRDGGGAGVDEYLSPPLPDGVPEWAGANYEMDRRRTYDKTGRVPQWAGHGAAASKPPASPGGDDADRPPWADESGSGRKGGGTDELSTPLLADA
mmetsp:Transcript_16606/g.43097  ORF Transcript_16606/g.43097 Transcript_16606/m.43097 type:complete len:120 (+) Transcript_16606:704-1063(+)